LQFPKEETNWRLVESIPKDCISQYVININKSIICKLKKWMVSGWLGRIERSETAERRSTGRVGRVKKLLFVVLKEDFLGHKRCECVPLFDYFFG